MDNNILGYIGGFFLVICYIPQIISISKNSDSILNIYFIYMQLTGITFMFVYGILNNLLPIIIINGVGWVFLMFIIILYNYNRRANITSTNSSDLGNINS